MSGCCCKSNALYFVCILCTDAVGMLYVFACVDAGCMLFILCVYVCTDDECMSCVLYEQMLSTCARVLLTSLMQYMFRVRVL
jgi:hypothetical protein